MREILFRGKRTDNGEWVYGFLVVHNSKKYIYFETIDEWCQTGSFLDGVEVIPETVGQFMGLTDKNGKKIFEGDICRLVHDWYDGTFGDWCAVVEFGNPNGLYSFGWQLKRISGEKDFNPDILLWVDMEETGATCEVIGNIHDNPKLLEEEE